MSRRAAVIQGAFYVATGLWPIVSIGTFEAVTGPKRERWLVQTVGALIAAVGGSLIIAAREPGARRTRTALAGLAGLALGAADVYFVARRRIPKVYLADAAVEAAFAGAALAEAMR
jgi:energy-converting hydrogenase Eha subunit E